MVEPQDDGVVQVVMLDVLAQQFERWLEGRGMYLFKIPDGDPEEIPTYTVGIKSWHH